MKDSGELTINKILYGLGPELVVSSHLRVAYVFCVDGSVVKEKGLFPDPGPFGGDTFILGWLSGEFTVPDHLGTKTAIDSGPGVLKIMPEHVG